MKDDTKAPSPEPAEAPQTEPETEVPTNQEQTPDAEPAQETEPEPAMYRSSLDTLSGPQAYPTFLSNLSKSFWDDF